MSRDETDMRMGVRALCSPPLLPKQTVTRGPSHGVSLENTASSSSPVMLSQTLCSPLGPDRWHGTLCAADPRSAVHSGVRIVPLTGPLLMCVSDVPILTNLVFPWVAIRPCARPVVLGPGGELRGLTEQTQTRAPA